jgi:hypothetical protein
MNLGVQMSIVRACVRACALRFTYESVHASCALRFTYESAHAYNNAFCNVTFLYLLQQRFFQLDAQCSLEFRQTINTQTLPSDLALAPINQERRA